MTLRTRITLIVTGSFLAMAAGIIGEGLLSDRALEARYGQAVVEGDRNAWSGILDSDVQRLRPQVELLAGQDDLVRAVAAQDVDHLGRLLTAEIERLSLVFDTGAVPRFEVSTRDGTILYDAGSGRAHEGRLLTIPVVQSAADLSTTPAGLARRSDGSFVVAAVAPVYTRDGLAAFLALWLPIDEVLDSLSQALLAEVDIVPSPRTHSGEHPTVELIQADGRRLFEAEFPLTDLVGRHIGVLQTVRDITADQRRIELARLLSFGAVGCALLLLGGFLQWYLRHSFRPLIDVIRVLNALARGDRAVRFEAPERRDEIGRLAATVSAFRGKLLELEETRAAKQRIENELAVARDIQLRIIPSGELVFPGRDDLRLHAVMEPARAVGGDLYDFFLVDQDRLFFVIGDVSDKGVPSALFMAIVRTVLKATMQTTNLPVSRLIATANRYLCENNPSAMFVTVFAGMLNTRTGVVEYCDGGHEPPLIRRQDGRIELVDKVGGLALGCVEDFPYASGTLKLRPGDTLILYTDGVTEATNEQRDTFSTNRLVDMLGNLDEADPAHAATRGILNAVRAFSKDMPQSDDITILALQYRGRMEGAKDRRAAA
jgi:serine phosphatase RsbU (regulator of sigma subunit)